MLTTNQVAKELNFSERQIYRWADRLGAVRFGRRCIRFNPKIIEKVKRYGLPETNLEKGTTHAVISRFSRGRERLWEK
jgi:hypothetical protein